MKRPNLAQSRWLITGATSGIGRAVALELGKAGAKLLLTGRRQDRLEQLCEELSLAGCECSYMVGDIADAAARKGLMAAVSERWQALDGLVNCAGVGAMGPFESADEERLRKIFEVNFFAAVELIRASLPLLRNGQRPIIVNIGSVLGHCAVPLKSEYCASKFALHGFSDALRMELRPQGIDVLLVSPSTTDSEFFDAAIEDRVQKNWKGRRPMSPQTVARHTLRAIRTGRREIILSAGGKALVCLDRLLPSLASRILSRLGR